jgi:hypothetical protein
MIMVRSELWVVWDLYAEDRKVPSVLEIDMESPATTIVISSNRSIITYLLYNHSSMIHAHVIIGGIDGLLFCGTMMGTVLMMTLDGGESLLVQLSSFSLTTD